MQSLHSPVDQPGSNRDRAMASGQALFDPLSETDIADGQIPAIVAITSGASSKVTFGQRCPWHPDRAGKNWARTLGYEGPDRGVGDPANSSTLRDLIWGRWPYWLIRRLEGAPRHSGFVCGVIVPSLD